MYSKFGFMFTELKVAGEDYILIKEEDIIGIMPRKSESRRRRRHHSFAAGVSQPPADGRYSGLGCLDQSTLFYGP